MNENHRYYCDDCREPFTPRLKEKKTKDGGAKQWFNCPACGKRYLVAKITRRGLEIRAKLQSYLKASPGFRKSNADYIQQLQKQTKREVIRAIG